MSVAALLAAAGGGERLGLGPKAFVGLAGRTLLEHACLAVGGVVDEIVVAVPEGLERRAAALVPRARVIAGGADRTATVAALIEATEASWLLVHDVARPLVPAELARRVLTAARAHGAASAGMAVADTVHDVVHDRPVPRDGLVAVQTPQGFTRELLHDAHLRARAEGRSATDDAQLVREAGHAVAWVEGSPFAHKVTLPADLAFLEALAAGASHGAARGRP